MFKKSNLLVLGIVGISLFLTNAYAENYTYTLHESELEDQYVTDTCMRLQINSPECDLVYGGITNQVSDGKLP